ncbi:MAG: hypothetical protein ACRCUS_00555 [Anaerovoracaceae bacterium]
MLEYLKIKKQKRKDLRSRTTKKYLILILLVVVVAIPLAGCSAKEGVSKPGVSPYKLSKSQKELMEAIGLSENGTIFSVKAPDEAQGVHVYVDTLQKDYNWKEREVGALGLTKEKISEDGTISIVPEGASGKVKIMLYSSASFSEVKIENSKSNATGVEFLTAGVPAELEKKIPMAMYIEDSKYVHLPGDVSAYFTPKQFKGMDSVKVITIKFTKGNI